MPNQEEFDLGFRPKSYWGPQTVKTWLGSHVKGELRKQQALEDSEEDHFDSEIIAESLSDEHRSSAARVHPWLMGGEYLPDLMPNEVEIARITMKSATMDVISIRARKTKHRIIYRIVDEYEPDFWEEQYPLAQKTSVKPLSMRELITLIDSAGDVGLVGAYRDYYDDNIVEEGPEKYYDFETASSAFYPELERWYDTLNEEWLQSERESFPRRQQEQKDRLAHEISATRSAAEKDDPQALNVLGYNHFLGRGVEHSREKAVEHWTQAAELGDPRGIFNLAVCFQDGIGVPRDQNRALELYEKLAADRYYDGLKMAGFCRQFGIGCEQDWHKALSWYFEIAKSHNYSCNDEILTCLQNMNGESALEKEVTDWIHGLPGNIQQSMLAILSQGRKGPLYYDASPGHLDVGQLMKLT